MTVSSKQPHHPRNGRMKATVIFCCQAIGRISADFPSLSLCNMKELTEKDRKKPFTTRIRATTACISTMVVRTFQGERFLTTINFIPAFLSNPGNSWFFIS
jgi:hypothetical protein